MKDKFLITISDVNGTKQYTISQFIKVIAWWIVIVLVITFSIGSMVVYSMHKNVEELKKEKVELKKEKLELKKQIDQKAQTLQAVSEQLSEAKKLIGLENDMIKESIKSQNIEDENTSQEITEIKKSDELTLSVHEFKLLSRLIPNGKPLKYKRISTRYGFRVHPLTKRKQFHPANDLTADVGTPIYAPADGVVVYAGKKRFYGGFLLIRHGLGFSTAYGHLHRVGVKSGEYVKKGQLVALSGNTGRSTGPHLHYELRYLSKWLDPEPFMKEWSFETYKDVIRKNKQVKWKELVKSIRDKIKSTKTNLKK